MAEKQLSINKWEKLINNPVYEMPLYQNEKGSEDEDSPVIKIKRTLSLNEMWLATQEIVRTCCPIVDTSEDNGQTEYRELYQPENMSFAMRRVIAAYYTNIRLPKDIDKQYDLCFNTDIIPRVSNYINTNQLQDIIDGATKQIEYKKQSSLSVTNKLENIISTISSALNGLENISKEDIDKIIESMNQLQAQGPDVLLETLRNNEDGILLIDE